MSNRFGSDEAALIERLNQAQPRWRMRYNHIGAAAAAFLTAEKEREDFTALDADVDCDYGDGDDGE